MLHYRSDSFFVTHLTEALMDNDTTFGGYEVPVDPMDLLQCDSCQ